MTNRIGYYYQPIKATGRHSIFSVRPHSEDITRSDGFTKWELLTEYIKRRFVSRDQVKYFARKKWVAVSSFRNRIYVCELCTEIIDDWLA